NIFELYIEEVVEACARLKGSRLPKQRLKDQLLKIAVKRTGGTRTDEILGHDKGPEGLPHSIIVTADGTQGAAPALPPRGAAAAAGAELVTSDGAGTPANGSPPSRRRRKADATPPATGTPARAAKGKAR